MNFLRIFKKQKRNIWTIFGKVCSIFYAIGKSSLYTGVSASSNTAIGSNALYSLTAGNFNVAMGENSARRLTAGTSNIFIGLNAGYNADDQHLRAGC